MNFYTDPKLCSTIPSGSTFQGATIQLSRNNQSLVGDPSGFGQAVVVLKTGSFNNSTALEAADYEAPPSAANVGSLTDGLTATTSLSAAGVSLFQTAHSAGTTGIQLRLEYSQDDNDNNSNDYVGYYSSDHNDSNDHPRLVIDYRLAD